MKFIVFWKLYQFWDFGKLMHLSEKSFRNIIDIAIFSDWCELCFGIVGWGGPLKNGTEISGIGISRFSCHRIFTIFFCTWGMTFLEAKRVSDDSEHFILGRRKIVCVEKIGSIIQLYAILIRIVLVLVVVLGLAGRIVTM